MTQINPKISDVIPFETGDDKYYIASNIDQQQWWPVSAKTLTGAKRQATQHYCDSYRDQTIRVSVEKISKNGDHTYVTLATKALTDDDWTAK